MRPEPNNEIDLLLRQLSRRNGSPVSENEEQHLDADELNSYVANALPPAARARYTEHLADCSSCRKLVAQLTDSQGPPPIPQSASGIAPSGLKSFLASLFSPMVLRYAVPALGLVVIAAVGFAVFRQNAREGFVAQYGEDKNRAQAPAPAEQAKPGSSPEYYNDHNYSLTNGNKAPAEKESTRSATGPAAPVAQDVPAIAKGAADATAAAAEPPPPAPKAAKVDEETDTSVDALKLKKDAPADKQAPAREATKEREEANKNEPAKAETNTVTVVQNETARRDVTVRSAKSAETNAVRGSDLKRAPAAPAGGTASTTGQADSRSREQSNDKATATGTFANAETRSVAGRRFRKTGGVWTDSGYDSSSAVTVVKRGSEQYRALIADEPSIRQIAEQLDGEILLVWKGRTYRIR